LDVYQNAKMIEQPEKWLIKPKVRLDER